MTELPDGAIKLGLESRHLVLDTNVYRTAGMSLENKLFARLRQSVVDLGLYLHANDLILSECKRRIEEYALAHAAAIKRLHKDAKPWAYLVGVDRPVEEFDPDKSAEEAFKNFERSLRSDWNLIVHQLAELRAENILRDYIDRKPPFANGSQQFADAFILQMASSIAERTLGKVYVVTADKAMAAAVAADDRLIHVVSLEAFIGKITELENPEVEGILDDLFAAPSFDDKIHDVIRDELNQVDFRYMAGDLRDPRIDDVKLNGIASLDDHFPLSVDGDEVTFIATVYVNVDVRVSFVEEDADHKEMTLTYAECDERMDVDECPLRILMRFDVSDQTLRYVEFLTNEVRIDQSLNDYIEYASYYAR